MKIGLVHLKPWVATQMGEEQGFVIQVVMILSYLYHFVLLTKKRNWLKINHFFDVQMVEADRPEISSV